MTSDIISEFRSIEKDYAWNPDIMNDEDERTSRVKEIISTRLSPEDRIIFLSYVDYQSYRKLGKKLDVSHMTVRRDCQRIKKLIIEALNELH